MSATVEQHTTLWCRCDARIEAHGRGEIEYSWDLRAWFYPDAPRRWMSAKAAYYALRERGAEFPHEDHRGEPVRIYDCPFCDNLLPGCEDDQADGAA